MDLAFSKKIFSFFGIDTHKFLFGIFEKNAKYLLDKKMKTLLPDEQNFLLEDDERFHYGDCELNEIASQYVCRSFTIDRIKFIRKCMEENDNFSVADLGDSNGIFIRLMGKTGISVNISDQTVKCLKNKKLDVVRANIEFLPFKNNSIDLVLLFETLEHVPNPVLLLWEIERVSKKSLILSIPYVKETHINRYNYTDNRPLYQYHIFEFNTKDFKNVIKLTKFSVGKEKISTVLNPRVSIFHFIIFTLWDFFMEKDSFCSCFKQFYICQLVKN